MQVHLIEPPFPKENKNVNGSLGPDDNTVDLDQIVSEARIQKMLQIKINDYLVLLN